MCSSAPILTAQEQVRFELRSGRECVLLTAGAGLAAAGMFVSRGVEAPQSIQSPERFFFPFDRAALRYENRRYSRLSDATLAAAAIIPLIISCSGNFREHGFQNLVMWSESTVLMGGFTLLCKGLFHRPRPYVYRMTNPSDTVFTKDAARSFFSGHTAAAFQSAVFAGVLLSSRFPNSNWITPVWILGLTAAASTACLRVFSGNHFPSDVLVGAMVGSIAGWIIPRIHRVVDEGPGTKSAALCVLKISFPL